MGEKYKAVGAEFLLQLDSVGYSSILRRVPDKFSFSCKYRTTHHNYTASIIANDVGESACKTFWLI